jgi:hypothetical protein
MVQATLDGRKKMTRRKVNFEKIAKKTGCTKGTLAYSDTFNSWGVFGGNGAADLCLVDCPYGKPGDILWVRETWATNGLDYFRYKADFKEVDEGINHKTSGFRKPYDKWKPSLFMPKSACRLWLEITDVKMERLQNISEEDAIKEGIKEYEFQDAGMPAGTGYSHEQSGSYDEGLELEVCARNAFIYLWKKINGEGSWDKNPWVWVVSFNMLKTS